MIPPLTPNTQAILLLTAPLGAGRKEAEVLSLEEYNRLARVLREHEKQPADLLGPQAEAVVNLCSACVGGNKLRALLGRGFLMAQAVERWNARAIWVISRADPQYPRRWKVRLREEAPPLLYGCGNPGLLAKGGLVIAASRNAESARNAETLGRLSAEAQRVIVSSGAPGMEQAAMYGSLSAGGEAVAVLADNLEAAALARENRESIRGRRLALVSPFLPAADASVEKAIERNKLVYALAEAALVLVTESDDEVWKGVVEQLDHRQFVPVFVCEGSKGNAALLRRGGRRWSNPQTAQELNAAILAELATPHAVKQDTFP